MIFAFGLLLLGIAVYMKPEPTWQRFFLCAALVVSGTVLTVIGMM